MKINKYSIMKNMALIFIMIIVVTTFLACSKDKSIVLNNDVKTNSKFDEDSIKVDEDFVYITKNNEGRDFRTSFWQNDKLFGTLLYDSGKQAELGIKSYIPKYFHAVDIDKKALDKTNKKAYSPVHRSIKEIEAEENGNLYYNDFSEGKSKRTIIGKLSDSKNKKTYKVTDEQYGMVDGNDRFATVYTYRKILKSNKCIGAVKLFDLKTNKLYENSNIGDIKIIKIVYVKDLKKFMVIDKSGICYEIKFKGDKLDIEKFSKIDIGDLKIEQSDRIKVCNGREISLISIYGIGKNRLIKYNFKTKQSNFIVNMNEKDHTQLIDYFPKQNIIVLEKTSVSKKDEMEKACSDIYLGEIKKGKLDIFFKSKYKTEGDKYSESLVKDLADEGKNKDYMIHNDMDISAHINSEGDKLALIRDIHIGFKNGNGAYISNNQVVDYYNIKRN